MEMAEVEQARAPRLWSASQTVMLRCYDATGSVTTWHDPRVWAIQDRQPARDAVDPAGLTAYGTTAGEYRAVVS
jgi:hypothetical protein